MKDKQKKETSVKKKMAKKSEGEFRLTPKGILWCALMDVLGNDAVTETQLNLIWLDFADKMKRLGYVKEGN